MSTLLKICEAAVAEEEEFQATEIPNGQSLPCDEIFCAEITPQIVVKLLKENKRLRTALYPFSALWQEQLLSETGNFNTVLIGHHFKDAFNALKSESNTKNDLVYYRHGYNILHGERRRNK